MKQATFQISEKTEQQISQEKNIADKISQEKNIAEKDTKNSAEKDTKNSALMTHKIPIKIVENIYYL